jgi:predicted permease
MSRLRIFLFRLRALVRSRQIDREIEDEMAGHLAEATEDYLRQGLSPEAAHRAARRSFGGVAQAREVHREVRSFMWLDDLRRDVREGLRTLRRTPTFTMAALLTLTLGIGANTAIFSILRGTLLRPLDYPKPEQVMYVTTQFPLIGTGPVTLSAPEYLELREVNRSFAAIGGLSLGAGEVNLTTADGARRARNANVDEHLLHALGLQAAHGRLFGRGETDRADPRAPLPPIAILSYELWQSAFGGQPIIGKTVEVNSRPREVIGIMPPGADVLDNRTEIWLPLGLSPSNRSNRRGHVLHVIGRLKDTVTFEAAQSELKALNEHWGERVGISDHMFMPLPTAAAARTSNPDAGHILQMLPLHDHIVGGASRAIWLLQGTAALVLLIACANLMSLLLARAALRRREFAVRTALGATRRRLLRQFMTEGALLSLAGSALALWLARFGLQTVTQAYPTALPRTTGVGIDLTVLLFTCGTAMLTTLCFGVAQLRQITVKGLALALTEAASKGTRNGIRPHVRRSLVVVEVALAVVLVAGAGLLMRTVYNLSNVDPGFNKSRLMTFSLTLPDATYPLIPRMRAIERLLDTLRAVPGVEGATAMWGLPPSRPGHRTTTTVANATVSSPGPSYIVDYYQYVMGDYFETMGIPIVRGRSFQPTDTSSSGLVAIVNEKFAETFWKGRDPIGQRVKPCCNDQPPWFTVVGVAKDVKQGGVDQETGTELYLSVPQVARPAPGLGTAPFNHVVLRSSLAPAALSQTVERVLREIDPAIPVVRFRDMDAVFAESIQRPRFLAQLLGLFAGLALLLAAVGTYGVVSSITAERRSEIAIRMALGANRSNVLTDVMREGFVVAGIGGAVGIGAAVGLSRLIAALLFGVQPTDVPTLAGVAATMMIVAAVASLLPAWRASRLDPNLVLRA